MTHPSTDQGVTAEDRVAAATFADWHEGFARDDVAQLAKAFRDHRLSSTAALEAEVERLKQRLESAEGVLGRLMRAIEMADADDVLSIEAWPVVKAARAFLQEQEKQNG